jgi:hypothetical protein
LIEIGAFLISREKDHEESAKKLDLTAPFTWQRISSDIWFKDLKTRANQINIVERRNLLQIAEEKLLKISSKEFLAELSLSEIKGIIE